MILLFGSISMRFRLIFIALYMGLAGPAGASTLNSGLLKGRANVGDGDTVTVQGARIRLHGIDAPEADQSCVDANGRIYSCGKAAREALVRLIGGRALSCSGQELDIYSRRLMTCHVDGTNINAAMVASGWALAYRQYSTIYVSQERAAQVRQTGLWAGAFVAPWDWRHRNAETQILGARLLPIDAQRRLVPQRPASADPVTGCRIKGNINQRKKRIYHVPGQRDYERTRITEKTGERWFCNEDEARAAGWRRAKN